MLTTSAIISSGIPLCVWFEPFWFLFFIISKIIPQIIYFIFLVSIHSSIDVVVGSSVISLNVSVFYSNYHFR